MDNKQLMSESIDDNTSTFSGASTLNQPMAQLQALKTPIAVRTEYIAKQPTTIVIEQHEYTHIGRDYTIHDGNNNFLFKVKASTLSMTQKRGFQDASGTPSFDLRRRFTSVKRHWYLIRPGEDRDGLMTAQIHWGYTLGLTITVHNQAASGAETELEFMEIGPHGKLATIRAGDVEVASIRRTARDGGSGEKFMERVSFKKRPIWTMHVAEGMDLSLVSFLWRITLVQSS